MITLGQYAFWPYRQRKIFKKAANSKPCTEIGKNLKPIIPASKWKPHTNHSEPNNEIQIDFDRPNKNENDQDKHSLACIDHFSKYPTIELFDKTNVPNAVKIWMIKSRLMEHQVISDYNKLDV